MKKYIKALLVATSLPVLTAASVANAQEYNLLSAPFGTGSYVMGAALEQIVQENHETLRINHSESPGFGYNHTLLDRDASKRETTIIGSGRGVNAAAAQGEIPFTEETVQVLLLANYNLGSQWLATLDPDIQSIADLEGKTVGLGRRPQINWTVQPEALLRTGWGLGDSVEVQYLGTGEALSALLDGQVDAAVVGGYFDPVSKTMQLAPATQQFLASGRDIYFLEWGHDAVEKVNASGMPLVPVTVPVGTLPGQDEPIEAYGDMVAWMAQEDFPEEAAYELTKLIINNVESFADAHALGELMSPESLAFGWDREEIHPGALRAYQEAGLLDGEE